MKQLVTLSILLFTSWASEAQISDHVKILGTWRLDSTSVEHMSAEGQEFMDANKQYIYMKFGTDSIIEMPSLEDEPGSDILEFGQYFIKDNQIFVLMDADLPGEFDGIHYTFIRDDYILLTDEEDLIYFKKDKP